MTITDRKAMVNALVGETLADNVVSAYLSLAQEKILAVRYPYGTDIDFVPPQYEMLQCELATRLYLRKGAEGEIAHNENGINRTYGNVDDSDLLAKVVPIAGLR